MHVFNVKFSFPSFPDQSPCIDSYGMKVYLLK